VEFAEVLSGALRVGLRLTPVNWHLTPDEVAYVVADCEAKALIADSRLADLALGTAERAPGATVRLAIGGEIAGFGSYEAVAGEQDASDLEDPVLGTTMLYTSGTTGRPKGVYRSQPTSSTATTRTIPVYGYRPGEDVHLCTGPLYHAAPLAFSLAVPLLCGVTVVLMDGWDAEETLRLVERHRVTHTHLVPTMFHRLLSLPEETRSRYDVSSLRFVVHGAAPCPVPVKQALMDWMGPIVYEYYAATEGTGSWVDPKTWLAHPGTVGKPVDPEGVRICDADGSPLPAGEVGLVFLKAPAVGRFEYFKDSNKTSDAYRGEYFTLGDMGYKDEDGFLYLTDRTANLIISGGVNIYPAEVDAVLLTHPAVGDAATIGVPHTEWGEEVKAVVELQPGLTPSGELAAELIEHCRDRLAHFKCPRSVDFVDELPRQDNGKIYKRVLRDRYRAAMSAAAD
jgi:long-chain acyl-CoA synthetase